MSWTDLLTLAFLLIAGWTGLRMGFWSGLLELVGVILGAALGTWVTPLLSPWIPGGRSSFHLLLLSSVALVVAASVVVLFRWLGRGEREGVPGFLMFLDRAFGLALGAGKGALWAGLLLALFWGGSLGRSSMPPAREARWASTAMAATALSVRGCAMVLPVLRSAAGSVSTRVHEYLSHSPSRGTV